MIEAEREAGEERRERSESMHQQSVENREYIFLFTFFAQRKMMKKKEI